MVINETYFFGDLRELFCKSVVKVFGKTEDFFEFLENEDYSDKYDCFLNSDGENYIINCETGEYINWYKLYHPGRCINISIANSSRYANGHILDWFEKFLVEFRESKF